jgi:C1A family cysteine protease
MSLNQFGALTSQEFADRYLNKADSTNPQTTDSTMPENLKDVNWNAAGYVTGVKNTGQCGSGWAFGATGALEFLYKAKTGRLASLSEQQLLDCDSGDFGCNGGYVATALTYAKTAGIASTDSYPYTAVKGTCQRFTPVLKFTTLSSALSCADLYNALQQRTVAVMVDARNFQFYSSGIFTNCGSNVNHGALLVGISNNNYWYVKN